MQSRLSANRSRLALALCALLSGVALVAHIIKGVPLPIALAAAVAIVALAATSIWRRTPLPQRRHLVRLVRVGASAGIVSAVAYDSSKFVLSRLDPTPYNPFEMFQIFGTLLTGSHSRATAIPFGVAFHLVNGTAFGIAYCVLFGRRGLLAGIAWGLGLEFFQLTLYPGWLGITLYREFVQFSALGHVVYGSVLGMICRRSLNATPSALPQ